MPAAAVAWQCRRTLEEFASRPDPTPFQVQALGSATRGWGVEHNLAKVGGVSSNLIARSNFDPKTLLSNEFFQTSCPGTGVLIAYECASHEQHMVPAWCMFGAHVARMFRMARKQAAL